MGFIEGGMQGGKVYWEGLPWVTSTWDGFRFSIFRIVSRTALRGLGDFADLERGMRVAGHHPSEVEVSYKWRLATKVSKAENIV